MSKGVGVVHDLSHHEYSVSDVGYSAVMEHNIGNKLSTRHIEGSFSYLLGIIITLIRLLQNHECQKDLNEQYGIALCQE